MFIVEEMNAEDTGYLIIRVRDDNYAISVQEYISMGLLAGDHEYKYRTIERLFQKLGRDIADKQLSGIREHHGRTGSFDNTGLGMSPPGQVMQAPPWRECATFQQSNSALAESQREAMVEGIFSDNLLYEWAISGEPKKDNKEEKAMKLLKEKIGKTKYKSLKEKGYFKEKGKHGEYRFMMNDPSGVRLIKMVNFGGKKRRLEATLCIQTQVNMPKGDLILSRWMSFKADEEKFQKTANFRDISTPDEAMEEVATVSMPSPVRPGSIYRFTTT